MSPRQVIRTLRRNPFVTVMTTVSLALSIGATAAVFSLFHQILLRELPVAEPGRLVNLSSPGPRQGNASCGDAGNCDSVFSYPMFQDLQRQQTVFTGIAAHVLFEGNFSQGGRAERGRGLVVSGEYFSLLGLRPALGRLLTPADDSSSEEPRPAVLSHRYWQRRFQGDPGVLNQNLLVNGQRVTVVGVAPEGFEGTTVGAAPQVFVPIPMIRFARPGTGNIEDRKVYWAYLFARLKSGVTLESASSSLSGMYSRLLNDVEAPLQQMTAQRLAQFRARTLVLEPGAAGQSQLHDTARIPLVFLLGVTVLVMLIACCNVANLLLGVADQRIAEISVRLSIGASRRQLVVQLLAEATLMALMGGAASLAVARWTLSGLATMIPPEVSLDFGVDWRVFAFTAAAALGTALLFGLFPALHSTRTDLASAMKLQHGAPARSRAGNRFRNSMATAQVGFSLALLILAGLFTKSLANVARADLGLNAQGVSTFRVAPVFNGYSQERANLLFERIEEQLRALPGVQAVAAANVPLLGGDDYGGRVKVEGFDGGPNADTTAWYNFIGSGYFKTLNIPLLAGRDFAPDDSSEAPRVAIVNEAFIRKFGLDPNPIGKHMSLAEAPALDIEIVGVVRNSKYSSVRDDARPVYFRPYRQSRQPSGMNFYIRTALDQPDTVMRAIPGIVAKLDSNLPVEGLSTLEQVAAYNTVAERVISTLSGAFAFLATVLAAVGLYGVLAHAVAQRTREIGVRMALGATRVSIRSTILLRMVRLTAVGSIIGLIVALGAGRFAESLLFQLRANDPTVITLAVLVIAVVALGAGLIPAIRASHIDPWKAIRSE